MNSKMKVYQIECENGSFEWVAECLDYKCVVGGGKTKEEAIAECKENLHVLQEYLKSENEGV